MKARLRVCQGCSSVASAKTTAPSLRSLPALPARVLVLSQCAFGDTLVLIPALRAVRRAWPGAHLTFVSEAGIAGRKVAAAEVLAGTGLADRFESLSAHSSRVVRLLNRIRLTLALRHQRWDVGLLLVPPVPPLTLPLLQRLRRYLALFGAQHIVAPEGILEHWREPSGSLGVLPHASEALLELLRGHGLPTEGCLDLPLLEPAQALRGCPQTLAEALLPSLPGRPSARPLRLAVAPGAQMPAKRWPAERYAELLRRLQADFAPRFVLFGGDADRGSCDELAGPGVDAVRVLGQPIPAVIEVMRRCDAYIGNDTGLVHLAAALAKPCVAIFSSRDAPGVWYPYGPGHTVFRTRIACEGCLATVCPRGDNACLQQIDVDVVHRACRELCRGLATALAAVPAPA